MKTITTLPYFEQELSWPKKGRHIMAHFDEERIVVYQAYRPEIGIHAVEHQAFGGTFRYNRMSWIKPNFLWMMYRSGWGTKEGQEVTLAISLRRNFFHEILSSAVASSFDASNFKNHLDWKNALSSSDVRLQWDPDHCPKGNSLERRAIQLGLRGDILKRYGQEESIHIENISDFVAEQRAHISSPSDLIIPSECSYRPTSHLTFAELGLE